LTDAAGALVELGVATLHEAAGRRFAIQGLALCVGPPFAGPAVTVALPAGDNLGVHLAIERASAGAVVCIASAGAGNYGVIGDLLVDAARARGIAGLLVDDGIRDLEQLEAPPSIAARGRNPRGTIKARVRQQVGSTVSIGRALIVSGDWVVCDHDGACVIPAEQLSKIIEAATARVARENRLRIDIKLGRPTRELLGLIEDPTSSLARNEVARRPLRRSSYGDEDRVAG